jgi:hypothetical protein
MFFGGTAFLLKLWYIDRMTLFYNQRRNEARDEASGNQPDRNRANLPGTP